MRTIPEGIKNLIFDFGGVIINIDFNRTFEEFAKLGIKDVKEVWKQVLSTGLLYDMERGLYSPDAFRKKMYEITGITVSDEVFDNAWNAMLLDIPAERVWLIEDLKKKYKVYLLSNTNEIHYMNYCVLLKGYGYENLDDLFDAAYFSFRMGKLKPEAEIFNEVVTKEGLNASETLFIDDLQENVNGAETAGLKGLCIKSGTIMEIFSETTE